jgi:phytoene synthase
MVPLLGATDPRAAAHAIDLGIAMQLTNICRDVREDALRDRIYLPKTRLRAAAIPSHAILGADLAPVIRAMLVLADRYYDSAREGLRHLPFRTRWAIHVALAVYRAIGIRLRDRHAANPSFGRTVVPWPARIGWSLVGLGEGLAGLWAGAPADHDASLHRAIADLPGTHEGAA